MHIIREISKLFMFTVLWGIPLLLAYLTDNNYYLWLFTMSFAGMCMMFGHYEDIERINQDLLKYHQQIYGEETTGGE